MAYQFELSWRQEELFNYVADLWQPVPTDRNTVRYELAYEGVPCFRDPFVDPGDVQEYGRGHRAYFRGHEEYHFAERQPIEQNWIIVDKTPDHDKFNHGWLVTGPPQKTKHSELRESGNTVVSATEQDSLPKEITDTFV